MTPMEPAFKKQFESDKRDATAQLLFKCARLVNERALDKIRERTGKNMRAAHTALFPHIDLDGTRQTTLAGRLGISKQAVGQLVDELVELGFLERLPDPSDGRAKLICLRPDELAGGMAVLKEVEQDLERMIGKARVTQLHRILLALEEVLSRE